MSALPAGPELDRLVAEKVMGWSLNPNPDKFRGSSINKYGQPILEVINVGSSYDALDEIVFEPSARIDHAWEVVAKMAPLVGDFQAGDGFFHLIYADSAEHSQGKGCDPKRTIEDENDDVDRERWSAHFHVGCLGEGPAYPPAWDHGKRSCARGATAALAICRAALLAAKS